MDVKRVHLSFSPCLLCPCLAGPCSQTQFFLNSLDSCTVATVPSPLWPLEDFILSAETSEPMAAPAPLLCLSVDWLCCAVSLHWALILQSFLSSSPSHLPPPSLLLASRGVYSILSRMQHPSWEQTNSTDNVWHKNSTWRKDVSWSTLALSSKKADCGE